MACTTICVLLHTPTRHPLLFAHNKWPATARRRIRTTLDKPFFSPFRLLRCICIYYNRILHPTFAQSHPKSRSQHFVAKVQLAYTTVIIHVRNEQNVSPDKNWKQKSFTVSQRCHGHTHTVSRLLPRKHTHHKAHRKRTMKTGRQSEDFAQVDRRRWWRRVNVAVSTHLFPVDPDECLTVTSAQFRIGQCSNYRNTLIYSVIRIELVDVRHPLDTERISRERQQQCQQTT